MTSDKPTLFDERVLLRPEDAGVLLSIGRSTVYKLMADGTLPVVMVGGIRRIPRRAIEALGEHTTNEHAPRLLRQAGGHGLRSHKQ